MNALTLVSRSVLIETGAFRRGAIDVSSLRGIRGGELI